MVGAGAAGLCAIKYFISKPQLFNVTAFELTQSVGGTWNYTEQTGCDQNGIPIHSSMYKNLKFVIIFLDRLIKLILLFLLF